MFFTKNWFTLFMLFLFQKLEQGKNIYIQSLQTNMCGAFFTEQ